MMAWPEALGLMAGALTTTAFVPQVAKTWRTGSAEDFSLPMLAMFVAGVGLWLVYGVLIEAPSVWLANGITGPLALYLLWVKLRRG
ncbi:MtN3 and saliva related transmembrane protein [Humitalea rosea]|uniref:MtN3 and saliva related transmembrane protein n=1 Tax=Humitalea rosea TaxID=990373 RepID=A0A2W7II56_9PROT|nr:SemiSWEET transporter [Humitalea rosea]PZW37659.1 MtN3 and saliva related transmembrane protein [Humitalea rosea]